MTRRIFAFLLCAALLAGCATRAVNVLAPIAEPPPPGAGRVEMLVATTRAASTDPGEMFTGGRSFEPSLIALSVSIPPPEARKPGAVQWPERLPPDPATDFAVLEARRLPADQLGDWARDHPPPSGRVAVFVHGYNSNFEASVYRYAQIAWDSRMAATPLLFSWPSRGSALDYVYDRDSATFSREALEEILRQLAARPEVQEISVVAHSMGSWLAMEALRQMAIRDGRVDPKIRDVALAAPDLDVDVFAGQFLELGATPPNIVVFVSRDDRALALSQRLGGGVDRLGQIDPNAEPYRTGLRMTNLTVVDLTGMKGDDRLNHGVFAQSPEIVRLLGGLIDSGEVRVASDSIPLDDQFTIFVHGAARTVGGAANLLLSAPAAILGGQISAP
ncbi:alpha/beta hydrolase [Neomegalonema sp.]|uniref:alpha/beta hydrolase n=1 Tax=Neomegalonema sp. TaxID=2039713 RepID=UPI0026103FD2|nr:alpha/beta hydrolase [Neomegalonema sp.]MDD2869478.1 alpha/beta hydrolase [Neomegalonema sp.]